MAVIEVEQRQRVRVIWLARPDARNALSSELVDALASALADADADEGTGAIVIGGRGKSFCAGGDLKGGMGMSGGFAAAHEGRGAYARLLSAIPKLGTPVVAAVQGDAMGGGLGLAAACDIVVAEEHARLGTPEIRLGLFPWIILAVLQRDVPRKHLAELIYTGGRWSAAEAATRGLVNRVVPTGEGMEVALELAGTIASRSPLVLKMGKTAFNRIADLDYETALAFMHGQLSLNLLTEDAMEGIAAFVGKREPNWKGR